MSTMTCPRCTFPIHPTQPQLMVITATYRDDTTGAMVDDAPVFHRSCAGAHLIENAHARDNERNKGRHGLNLPADYFKQEKAA